MSFVLLAIAVVLPWIVAPRDREAEALCRLDRVLLAVEVAARGGCVDPWRAAAGADMIGFDRLGRELAAARRAGRPIAASVAALRREVGRARSRARRRLQLLGLMRGRLSLAIAAAAAARLGLEGWIGDRVQGVADAACLTAAAAATGLVARLFASSLPSTWLWAGKLSECAPAWLRSHLDGLPGAVAGDEVAALCRRELRQGVGLRVEKRRVLIRWARERAAVETTRLRAGLEALPIIEIAGFGLIAGLILAQPAVAALGWTEGVVHVKDEQPPEGTP